MNRNALLFVVLGIAVLGGLFWWFKPEPEPAPLPAAAAPLSAPAAATEKTFGVPASRVFEVAVSKGRLASGPAQIQVHAGEMVTLHVTSDQDDELHLHGYDLHLSLRAGQRATLMFKAEHSGRFDYELHHAHLELGTLEVLPQ
jgi:FtsP/CotA-like multicopper oxidase with cupredoxin domain